MFSKYNQTHSDIISLILYRHLQSIYLQCRILWWNYFGKCFLSFKLKDRIRYENLKEELKFNLSIFLCMTFSAFTNLRRTLGLRYLFLPWTIMFTFKHLFLKRKYDKLLITHLHCFHESISHKTLHHTQKGGTLVILTKKVI